MNSVRREALRLLRSAYFFSRLLGDLRRAGLVGEEINALAVYIVATSRLLPEPLALFVKGPSSVGKNWLTDKVLDFIPASEVRKLTASSEKSWNYQDRNLAHKVVYLKERNDASGPVHPLRLLISEKELVYYVTVRQSNQSSVQRMVTKGPIAAISTTTKDRLEVDDETRHLSIWLDESSQQTSRIVDAAIERELEGSPSLSPDELACWHEVQHLLKSRSKLPVRFPTWFRELSRSLDTSSLWARRYFSAFMRAVKTVALIRSFRWKGSALRVKRRIPVFFSDVAIATFIFGPVFAESLGRAEDMDVETRHRVAVLSARRDGKGVSAWDVSKEMGISMDKAYALLRKAESAGTIYRANSPSKTNRKLYLPSALRGFLPEPDEMFKILVNGPKHTTFVHPLTGRVVRYERE